VNGEVVGIQCGDLRQGIGHVPFGFGRQTGDDVHVDDRDADSAYFPKHYYYIADGMISSNKF